MNFRLHGAQAAAITSHPQTGSSEAIATHRWRDVDQVDPGPVDRWHLAGRLWFRHLAEVGECAVRKELECFLNSFNERRCLMTVR